MNSDSLAVEFAVNVAETILLEDGIGSIRWSLTELPVFPDTLTGGGESDNIY